MRQLQKKMCFAIVFLRELLSCFTTVFFARKLLVLCYHFALQLAIDAFQA
jgi:hypothetical protein